MGVELRSGCFTGSINFKQEQTVEAIKGMSNPISSTIPAALPKSSSRIPGAMQMSFKVQIQQGTEGRVESAVKGILKQTPAAVRGMEFSVQGFSNNERAAAQIRKELQQSRKAAICPGGTVRKFDQKGVDDLEIHYFEVQGRARFKIHLPEGATSYSAMETAPAIAPKLWIRSQVKQQQELLPGENVVTLQSGKQFVFTVGKNRHVKFEQ